MVMRRLPVVAAAGAVMLLAGCGEQAASDASAASEMAALASPSSSAAAVPAGPASRAQAVRQLAAALRGLRRTGGGQFTQTTYVGTTAMPLQDLQGTWTYRPARLDATARAVDTMGRVDEVEVRSVGGVGYLRLPSRSASSQSCWLRVDSAVARGSLAPALRDVAVDGTSAGGLPTGFTMLDSARGATMMGPGMIQGTVSVPAAVRLLPAALRHRVQRLGPTGRVRATFSLTGRVLSEAAVQGVDLRPALQRSVHLTPADAAEVAQDDVLIKIAPAATATPSLAATASAAPLPSGNCS